MNTEETRQLQKGAEMILERCRRYARDLDVDLKGVKWKEDVSSARNVYTLVIDIGRSADEVPLSHTEVQSYSTGVSTQGTDEKLKSVIQKRPSGY